jgi:hypothetical protein
LLAGPSHVIGKRFHGPVVSIGVAPALVRKRNCRPIGNCGLIAHEVTSLEIGE